MNKSKSTWAHIQILLIVSVFLGPLVFGTWMYYGGYLNPQIQKEQAYYFNSVDIEDELPNAKILKKVERNWALIYSNRSTCLENCRNDLKIIKKSHEILVQKIGNVRQVFLHGESPPDKVFLKNEHKELIVIQDYNLSDLLEKKTPTTMNMGGYFLMDPEGNLVMYFESKTDPKDIAKSLENLPEKTHIN